MRYFKKTHNFSRFIVGILTISMVITSITVYFFDLRQNLYANFIELPLNNTILNFNPKLHDQKYNFPVMRGIAINSKNPFKLNFYFDAMNASKLKERDIKRMIDCFSAFLTLPEDKLWVNLSPYEFNRIMPDVLSKVDLGKDLLLSDYFLKQFTASLTDPETDQGKKFWQKVYAAAQRLAGTTKVPIKAFYKVWIVPDVAEVYEYQNNSVGEGPCALPIQNKNKTIVFVKEAKLKVQLEEDHVAYRDEKFEKQNQSNQNKLVKHPAPYNFEFSGVPLDNRNKKVREINNEAKGIFKRELLPIIEKQVNESITFAPLRQIYYVFILAKYFKTRYAHFPLYRNYVNRERIEALKNNLENVKETIYNAYLKQLENSAYSFIDPKLKRKCFSGGMKFNSGFNLNVTCVSGEQLLPRETHLQAVETNVLCEQDNSYLEKNHQIMSNLKGRLAMLSLDTVKPGDDLSKLFKAWVHPAEIIEQNGQLNCSQAELASLMRQRKEVIASQGLSQIETPLGLVDLNRLNHIDSYFELEDGRIQFIRDLEIAYYLCLINITDFGNDRLGMQSPVVQVIPGSRTVLSWSDSWWLCHEVNKLVQLGESGVYQGNNEAKSVGEIIRNDRGQAWFYRQILGEKMRNRELKRFYTVLPKKYKDDFFHNWHSINQTYSEYMQRNSVDVQELNRKLNSLKTFEVDKFELCIDLSLKLKELFSSSLNMESNVETLSMSEIARRIRCRESLFNYDLEVVSTPIGVINLSRLNNALEKYQGPSAKLEFARDLEIAHWIGLIRISNFNNGRVGMRSAPVSLIKGYGNHFTWSDLWWFFREMEVLVRQGKEGVYRNIPVSRILANNDGQVLFYQLVFGVLRISTACLSEYYDLIPIDFKQGIFKSWSRISENYSKYQEQEVLGKEAINSKLSRINQIKIEEISPGEDLCLVVKNLLEENVGIIKKNNVFTHQTLIEKMRKREKVIDTDGVFAVESPLGRIDLSRLNNVSLYQGKYAWVELARDLEIAHWIGLLTIAPFPRGGKISWQSSFMSVIGQVGCEAFSWSDIWWLQHEIYRLSEMKGTQCYSGKKKVSEILADNDGQIWFYCRIYGKERFKKIHFPYIYGFIPQEFKGSGNLLGAWSVFSFSGKEVMHLRKIARKLSRCSLEEIYKGKKVSEILANSSQQAWFYASVLGENRIKGTRLDKLYLVLPEELKPTIFKEWRPICVCYSDYVQVGPPSSGKINSCLDKLSRDSKGAIAVGADLSIFLRDCFGAVTTDKSYPLVTLSTDEIIERMKGNLPLFELEGVRSVQTAIGLVDLNRLNHIDEYRKIENGWIDFARDLEVAQHLKLIHITGNDFKIGSLSKPVVFFTKDKARRLSWSDAWWVRKQCLVISDGPAKKMYFGVKIDEIFSNPQRQFWFYQQALGNRIYKIDLEYAYRSLTEKVRSNAIGWRRLSLKGKDVYRLSQEVKLLEGQSVLSQYHDYPIRKIIFDNSGQRWFYEKIFGDELEKIPLSDLYDVLPLQTTDTEGVFANWTRINPSKKFSSFYGGINLGAERKKVDSVFIGRGISKTLKFEISKNKYRIKAKTFREL